MVDFKFMNSLTKIYPDRDYSEDRGRDRAITSGSMLLNDVYSFQIVYKSENCAQEGFGVSVTSDGLDDCISVRFVDLEPCDLTVVSGFEEVTEHKEPGLMPDILRTIPKTLWSYGNMWRALWVTVDTRNRDVTPGEYKITVQIWGSENKKVFTLNVLNFKLPEQTLPVTNWFHSDGLCHYYHVEYMSEEYWRIAENFVKGAVNNGVNTILTSIFTPPLDTDPDGERLTTQLVDVKVTDGKYEFGFKNLERWIDMCLGCGVKYFEISHLFTQWGCRFAPKIIADIGGEKVRLFKKDEPGYGETYKNFIGLFLPELTRVLKSKGVFDRCFFHISDEPNRDVIDNYRACADIVKQYVPVEKIIDAMSDPAFVTEGLISTPVASISAVDRFLEKGIDTAWGYYCCGNVYSANRFIACSSVRNRILGLQLFKYNLKGFLQWGYNFYNSFLSREEIDPYSTCTALGWVPGGDPFEVYPGADGKPIESIRFAVFAEALQDYRALTALLDRGYTRGEICEKLGFSVLPFEHFDENAYDLPAIRDRVNHMLAD